MAQLPLLSEEGNTLPCNSFTPSDAWGYILSPLRGFKRMPGDIKSILDTFGHRPPLQCLTDRSKEAGMRLISRRRKLGMIFAGLLFPLIHFQPTAFAETRLFVPNFRFGAGSDTQLLISNNNDGDTTVDLWVFMNKGRLLGQEQLLIKAHATRSLTLSEVFGSQSLESRGWLAAVSNGDGIQMSYNLIGERTETHDAETWPRRELTLDIPQGTGHLVRLVNTSP